jgi:PhzF family phenazine biosynthesis protein
MHRPLFIIDAFTDRPFGGNPAAVILLDEDDQPDTQFLQNVAAEMNLSETAFVTLNAQTGQDFRLRWFTPKREVDLCGHATLAAAHALYDAGRVSLHEPIEFETRSGILRAAPDSDWRGFWIDLPITPPIKHDPPPGLLAALGVTFPDFIGKSSPPDGRDDGSDNDYHDWFVEVPDPDAVARVEPDFAALARISEAEVASRGVIVSASGQDATVASRCFYPAYGIDEDPVTGSAHCTIGPYFARTLRRQELDCRQLSSRGGHLRVHVDGDAGRVHLGGRAVTTVRGDLVI